MAQFIVINSPFSFYWNWMMKMTDTTASRHKISMLKLMDKNEAVHVYGTKLAYSITVLEVQDREKVVTFFMATLLLSLLISGA
jgi:hypothetical protein